MRVAFTQQKLATRVRQLGRAISKDFSGRTVHVLVVIENGYLFAADLIRAISAPVVCHFVRAQMRDVEFSGHDRREIFFSWPPDMGGRDVLLVDAVLNTGVTQDFLMKQILESRPRSLRLAVLLDKPDARKVDVKAEYSGFSAASNYLVGYGLSGRDGLYRNLPYIAHSRPARPSASTSRGKGRRRVKGQKG